MKNPWIPFTDLLSGFVVVVLMMFVSSVVIASLEAMEAAEAEAERQAHTMGRIADKLASFAESGLLSVDIERRSIELNEVSFASGSACLSEAATNAIASVSPDVLTSLERDESLLLQVEGHTDPVPVGALRNACGYFADNTQLSTLRAANVKSLLLAEREREFASRLAVTGWGPEHLRNREEPTAAENRRVEVHFRWRTASPPR